MPGERNDQQHGTDGAESEQRNPAVRLFALRRSHAGHMGLVMNHVDIQQKTDDAEEDQAQRKNTKFFWWIHIDFLRRRSS